MSRKTLMAVFGVLMAVAAFFGQEFGLSLDAYAVLGGLLVALTYIFWEAKDDIKRLGLQPEKWKDPKFWVSLVSVILISLNQNFGMNIPVEVITPALMLLITAMFRWLNITSDKTA